MVDVVNAGKTVWDIMQDGKASSSAKSAFCSAVPKGVKNSELSGWKNKSGSWKIVLENLYTWDVITAEFVFSFDYGGHTEKAPNSFYVNNFMVYTKSCDVSWGYTFDVRANVKGNPVNVGSPDKQNWAIPLLIKYSASGLNSKSKAWQLVATGTGKFQFK